jgi:Domain of unknown function (DUF4351)
MLSEEINECIEEVSELWLKAGEAQLLLRQLDRRFGPLTAEVQRRVAAADSAQLLLWGDRVLTAATIDEALADVLEGGMLSETIKGWMQAEREKGRREGRQRGEAELLLRLLERRFGSLTSKVRRRIVAADSARLLVWGDRVLTAARIEEVLAD